MRTRSILGFASTLGLAAACGSSSANDQGAGGASTGNGATSAVTTASSSSATSTSTAGSTASSGGTSSASSGVTSSGAGGSGGSSVGLASLGTLVVLGDSISDGGGQPPFYYDLLKADLTTKYGAIAYHNNAQSGSTTGALVSQINSLPNTLAAPVAVVITSGGNDMKSAIAAILTGTDGPLRQTMAQHIQDALDALLMPNRFGNGVDVHVYEGNIYDASDGAGDFGSHNCAFGQGLPTIPSDGFFMNWNDVITMQVQAASQTLADMHAYFYGHGYKSNPDWYAPDCTHPSQTGHSELRKLFYKEITGQALP